jgi:hypothetical protein
MMRVQIHNQKWSGTTNAAQHCVSVLEHAAARIVRMLVTTGRWAQDFTVHRIYLSRTDLIKLSTV